MIGALALPAMIYNPNYAEAHHAQRIIGDMRSKRWGFMAEQLMANATLAVSLICYVNLFIPNISPTEQLPTTLMN